MKYIDLSHEISDGMPVFPGLERPRITAFRDREQSRPHYQGESEFYISKLEMVAAQAKRGNELVLSGEFSGIRVAYLATDGELGVITEIFSGTPGPDLRPDATYP